MLDAMFGWVYKQSKDIMLSFFASNDDRKQLPYITIALWRKTDLEELERASRKLLNPHLS